MPSVTISDGTPMPDDEDRVDHSAADAGPQRDHAGQHEAHVVQ